MERKGKNQKGKTSKSDIADLDRLLTIEETCMSNIDINKYFPGVKTVSYSDLADIDNIYQLLPQIGSYIFLLYQNSEHAGHWVALMRSENCIEYFDSYGGQIDAPLNWLTKQENKELGIMKPYLTKLLIDSGEDLEYNGLQLQQEIPGMSTCGRHCCLRIKKFIEGYDLKTYLKLLELTRKKTRRSYDEIVAALITK